MATDPITKASLDTIYRVSRTVAAGAFTLYFPLDPTKDTAVNVFKDSETITIEFTFDTHEASTDYPTSNFGARLTDLEDSGVNWNTVSSDTADYLKGDNKLLTGVRISGTPASNTVEISILQWSDD